MIETYFIIPSLLINNRPTFEELMHQIDQEHDSEDEGI